MSMLHISLFSGIGGFDLASEWMGWQNIVSCEINPFSRKVLQHYWPNAYHHDDIRTLTYEKINQELTKRYGSNWRTNDIILTGGFPCQPYSVAGKRLGKEDERHLWPHMLRAIREIQPTWVVGENVRGIINWNGGMVFDEVQADLEAAGYEVIPFILPACGVNAPHRRDRVWFIAYRNTKQREWQENRFQPKPFASSSKKFIAYSDNARRSTGIRQVSGADEEVSEWNQDAQFSNSGDEFIANANNEGLQRIKKFRGVASIWQKRNKQPSRLLCTTWENFPTQSPVLLGNDGISERLDRNAIQDLLKGGKPREPWIPFSKWRNESIRAAGNAVVPQVVLQIFKAIQAVNDASGQPER